MLASGKAGGVKGAHSMALLVLLAMAAALGSEIGEQEPTPQGGLEVQDPENSASDAVAEEIRVENLLPASGEKEWNHEGWHPNLTTGGPVKGIAGLSKPSITAGPNKSHGVNMSVITTAVPLVILLVAAVLVALVFVRRRQKSQSRSSHETQDEEFFKDNAEKIPMPKFEEDVPSVLELEMEDLEKWITKGSVDSGLDSRHEN